MRRILLGVLHVALVLVFAFSIFSTLAFIAARSRDVAIPPGELAVPNGCEAIVNNHGQYVCWWTIWEHPFRFIASGMVLAGTAFLLAKVEIQVFRR